MQYIGISQDVDRRINAHRKAGRLPFAQLGDPAIEVLHFGLDVYAACDDERREIMARRTMTPHGYNESLGGEYAGSRSDTLFSSDHLHRLSRAAVGVERMDRATHEEEAGSLAASGVEAVMERYWNRECRGSLVSFPDRLTPKSRLLRFKERLCGSQSSVRPRSLAS